MVLIRYHVYQIYTNIRQEVFTIHHLKKWGLTYSCVQS